MGGGAYELTRAPKREGGRKSRAAGGGKRARLAGGGAPFSKGEQAALAAMRARVQELHGRGVALAQSPGGTAAHAEGLTLLQQALALFDGSELLRRADPLDRAALFSNIGNTHVQLGCKHAALKNFETALTQLLEVAEERASDQAARAQPAPAAEEAAALLFVNIARTFKSLSMNEECLLHLTNALQIREKCLISNDLDSVALLQETADVLEQLHTSQAAQVGTPDPELMDKAISYRSKAVTLMYRLTAGNPTTAGVDAEAAALPGSAPAAACGGNGVPAAAPLPTAPAVPLSVLAMSEAAYLAAGFPPVGRPAACAE